jgi:hypothetical protein
MPRTVSDEGPMKVQVTVSVSRTAAAELRKRGEEIGSQNEAARQLLDDYFNWYQLPVTVVELLSNDAKAKKLSQRDYIVFALMSRYDELRQRQQRKEK